MYNIHSLLHVIDDALFFDCSLDEVSSFPFENYSQTLKRLVCSPSNPILQVVKRIKEFETVNCPRTSTAMKLSSKVSDSLVLLKNGKYAEIVFLRDDVLVCEVYRRSVLQPFFTEPCSSDFFDTVFTTKRAGNTVTCEVKEADILHKTLKDQMQRFLFVEVNFSPSVFNINKSI